MSKSILIIGGKPTGNISELLNKFDKICRVNLSIQNKLANNKDIFYVNNHVYNNIFKEKKSPNLLKASIYNFVNLQILYDIHKIVKNKEYSEVIQQYESGVNYKSNKILKDLKCPYSFLKAPRCGYQAILYFLLNGYNVSIVGFSKQYKKTEETFYNKNKTPAKCHNIESEYKVLNWLIDNNIIKYY